MDRESVKRVKIDDGSRPDGIPMSQLWTTGLSFMLVDVRKSGWTQDAIRLFGTTADGCGVMVEINDFRNWFYIDLGKVVDQGRKASAVRYITQVAEKVENVMARSCYTFTAKDCNMLKVYLKSTKKDTKRIVEILDAHVRGQYKMFDDLEYVFQYLCETNVSGGSWVTIPPGMMAQITNVHALNTCSINVSTSWMNVKCDPSRIDIAPLRVVSFDIECQATRFTDSGQPIFVHPDFDPVITIGNYVYVLGQGDEPLQKIAFQLKETADIGSDGIVKWFDSEAEMLREWFIFMRRYDFDLMFTYNGTQFDFWYLIQRCVKLGISADFSRDGSRVQCYSSHGSTKKTSAREQWKVSVPGRINFDVFMIAKISEKLRSYTLNAVATEFVGEQKINLHHTVVNKLQDGSPEDRARIVRYCLRDCDLPYKIVVKQMYLVRLIELGRVTGTPMEWLVHRGQAVKASLQIRRYLRAQTYCHLVVPHHVAEVSNEKYEGAVVIEPHRGFYNFISTLDFNSLYPNIIRARNLCYTTQIPKSEVHLVPEDQYIISRSGEAWAKPEVRRGILPQILTNLLDARTRAKTDLKSETDPSKRSVLDARQLALKITANAVYGFTGARVADMPMLEIASSVTADGRHMINKSKSLIESHFTKANGFKGDAHVRYGDSVAEWTPIIVKRSDGLIDIVEIRDLATEWKTVDVYGKQQGPLVQKYVEVMSDKGFSPIKRVLRHQMRPESSLVEVKTGNGYVVATDDHSLLLEDETEISPKDVKSGETMLLHTNVSNVFQGDLELEHAFILGMFFDSGSCVSTKQGNSWSIQSENLEALKKASLCMPTVQFRIEKVVNAWKMTCTNSGTVQMLATRWRNMFYSPTCARKVPRDILNSTPETMKLFIEGAHASCRGICFGSGYGAIALQGLFVVMTKVYGRAYVNLNLASSGGIYVTRNGQQENANQVDYVVVDEQGYRPTRAWVYDIETENHHFAAGVGNLVVHNTDSVMIEWGGNDITLDETKDLSDQACEIINEEFPKPNKIVFEKTFKTYLLINKKRYSGLKCEIRPDGTWKMFLDSSGLETVRRDNCTFLVDILNECLRLMCVDGSPENAMEYAESECIKLIEGKITIDRLIVTMEYKNHWSTYKSLNAAASLAQRTEERPGAQPYQNGSRIAYVVVVKPKSSKKCECSEDPLRALEKKMTIDYQWYLTNMLAKPLQRIFQFYNETVMKHFTHGPHLKKAIRPKLLLSGKKGLLGFLKPKSTCVVCKANVRQGERICSAAACREQEIIVIDDRIQTAKTIRQKHKDIWDGCHKCAGDVETAAKCSNRECDKFYVRQVIKNQLDETIEQLKKINVLNW